MSEFGHLAATVGALLGLGVVMAFSPTTFGIEVRSVRHADDLWRRALVVVTGVGLAASLLALLVWLVGPVLLATIWHSGAFRSPRTQAWIVAVVGVLLIAAGVWRWRQRHRAPHHRLGKDLDRPRVLLAVVFVESLVSASGPATMYLVIRTIGSTSPLFWPFGYAIFLIGLAAPYLAIAVAIQRHPHRSTHRPVRRRQWRGWTALGLVVAGVVLLGWAVFTLTSSAGG